MEKKLEGQEDMAIRSIDMEKAYAIIPREITMVTLRWMEVQEAEVRMVEGTKSRVLCGPGVSGESTENVGLTKGSVFVPDKQND